MRCIGHQYKVVRSTIKRWFSRLKDQYLAHTDQLKQLLSDKLGRISDFTSFWRCCLLNYSLRQTMKLLKSESRKIKWYILNDNLLPSSPGAVGNLYVCSKYSTHLNRSRFIYNPILLKQFYSYIGKIKCSYTNKELSEFDRKFRQVETQEIDSIELIEHTKGLDLDVASKARQMLTDAGDFTYNYNASLLRYIRQSICHAYSSCGINKYVLRKILSTKKFNGLKVIDFGFGNGEVLEVLKGMGAKVVGLDSNFIMVQRMRDRGIDAYAVEVDCPPSKFKKEGFYSTKHDVAISTLLLDRLKNPKAFLLNFFSLIKHNGKFALQILLPIIPVDDDNVSHIFTYTPVSNRLTPGNNLEEDKNILLGNLVELGAKKIKIYQLSYKVFSSNQLHTYNLWSFCGILNKNKVIKYENLKLYKAGVKVVAE